MLVASRRPAAVASRLSMQPWFLLAVLATWPFAGCAIRYEPELSDRAVMPGYSVAEVLSLADRTLKVEVYGNPFAAAPQAFEGQVAANMNQSAAAPAHFAAHATSSAETPYRIVWNFAPPRQSVAPNAICQGQYEESTKAGMPIDAYAAFCRGGQGLSSVRGRLYYTDTQNSLEFLSLVDAMTAQLFPKDPTGPRRSGDSPLGKRVSHPF